MTNEKEVDNDGKAISIAIIAVIITILLQIVFLPFESIILKVFRALGVFSVVLIIVKYILNIKNINTIIINFINKPVRIKWLLTVIIFAAIILVVMVTVISRYDHIEGIDGKVKCVLPDNSVKIFNLYDVKSSELACIFPQVAVPFSGTYTYATSGKIKSKFNKYPLEGRECYTEITFQNFCSSYDCNSGWMISPLWGYNASAFAYISFWVKGAKGEENFGIKIKDTRGTEVKVEILEYIEDKKISTNWQKVIIPLEHFLNVDMSTIEVISLYSDGKLSYKDSETVYVTNFKFS